MIGVLGIPRDSKTIVTETIGSLSIPKKGMIQVGLPRDYKGIDKGNMDPIVPLLEILGVPRGTRDSHGLQSEIIVGIPRHSKKGTEVMPRGSRK